MLEFEDIYELNVTHGDFTVLKKINETTISVQHGSKSFTYQKDDLENALFAVIAGYPTIICFKKSYIALIRYVNGEFTIEFDDKPYIYIHHDFHYIYFFDAIFNQYVKYGSVRDFTYYRWLYVNQKCSELYISDICPKTTKYHFNLGKLKIGRDVATLKCQDKDLYDVSHVTLTTNNRHNYLSARCYRIECKDGELYDRLIWHHLKIGPPCPIDEFITPHIINIDNKYYAMLENNLFLLPITVLSTDYAHSWYYNNYLYISDKTTRVFGVCHQNNIRYLIRPLLTRVYFLVWCLQQKTSFNNKAYKYYLPLCVFIDCILTRVLIDV